MANDYAQIPRLAMKPSAEPFSILLVNYKTLQLTTLCLSLLKKHIDLDRTDVVVVDNGSNDDSLTYLRSLDWIKLVEREQTPGEPAFISHGEALDEGLKHIASKYVCLLHTDTFVHNSEVFEMLLTKVMEENVAAVGTTHQRHRRIHKRAFRFCKKAMRYYYRRLCVALGFSDVAPKPYKDTHLKSFCCMWNYELIKRCELRFSMGTQNPGYKMQNILSNLGFNFVDVGTGPLFRHLDHVQSGTVVEMNVTKKNERRYSEYERIVKDRMTVL